MNLADLTIYEITYHQILDGEHETAAEYTTTYAAPEDMDPMDVLLEVRRRITSEKWPWTDDDGVQRVSAVTDFTLRSITVIRERVEVVTR